MTELDKEHLNWIYHRLLKVYNENPCVDYMLRFRKILDNYEYKMDKHFADGYAEGWNNALKSGGGKPPYLLYRYIEENK